jgi:hypothetical protein
MYPMTATLTAPIRLRIEDLEVSSYATTSEAAAIQPAWTDPQECCCTGCDSGCGIIPTGGGCESADTDTGEGVCW